MLGALLGGLAGILFPKAGAAAAGAAATGIGGLLSRAALPALGAGLGTLATGGSGKDAIRNALMFGAGSAALPGLVSDIRGSEFGRGVTGGLASIFGMPQGPMKSEPSVSTSNLRPRPRPAGLGAMPTPPIEGSGRPPLESTLGPSAMEMEIQGRRQPTALPTISEMVDINRKRSEDRAAAGFDIQEMFPVSDMEDPYNMVRPEMGVSSLPAASFNMVRPEAEIERVMGMTTVQGNADRARRAYERAHRDFYESGVYTPEARYSAIDFLLANRSPRLTRDMLVPDGVSGFAQGGEIEGPGTGTSDSIPAMIYQDGKPVREAALSDGEFVMTADAVKGAGNGSRDRGITRMYELMRRFERGEMA